MYFEFVFLLGGFRSAHFVDEGLFLQYLVLGTEARCSSYLFCQPCVLNFGINAVFGWAKPAGQSGLLPEDKLGILIKDRGRGDQSVHWFTCSTVKLAGYPSCDPNILAQRGYDLPNPSGLMAKEPPRRTSFHYSPLCSCS